MDGRHLVNPFAMKGPSDAASRSPESSGTAGTSSLSLARTIFGRLIRQGRLRQLQLLVMVEECGSIARAAAELCMSQSAATQALAELERVVGMRLFERHARGIRPTASGHGLISHAREVIVRIRQAAEYLATSKRGTTNALRIGSIPAASYALIAPLLPAFYSRHPDVHIDLAEDTDARLLPVLIGGGLDALFCRTPLQMPAELTFEPLLEDDAIIVAASSHPLSTRAGLAITALDGARWVLPASSVQLRELFDRVVLSALPDAMLFPLSTISLSVLEGFLQQPGAVTLLPRSVSGGLIASGRVRQLDVDITAPLSPLGVVYRAERASELLQVFLSIARQWMGDRNSILE
ncbi:molybdate transport repressor ModE-like protein [Cupriavidus alkaliphilus]|nr:molybdate transport repressor ModE-like protein [Cupriavidus alkaliphilus]